MTSRTQCDSPTKSAEAQHCDLPGCPLRRTASATLVVRHPENAAMRMRRIAFEHDLTIAFPRSQRACPARVGRRPGVSPCAGAAE